jgi:hypothetical protein
MTVLELPGTWTYRGPPDRPEGESVIPECCPGMGGAGGASPRSAAGGASSTGFGDCACAGMSAAADITTDVIKHRNMSASLPLV